MITMCMFFAMYAYLSMAMNTIGEGTSFNLATFAYVMFIIVITFALTQSAPKIAVTLLTGQPQLSMGELVAAMGTAAAAGGAAAHAAGMTAGAVQKAAPAAARMAADRIGDAAAIAGAGRTASGAMAAAGGSKGEQGFAGLKAMGSEAMYRTGQRFKSALHGAAHSGMKGDSMGGPVGGGSGAGSNRFHGEKGKGLDPESDMRYGMASNVDEKGNKISAMTAGEYWRKQAADAAARHSAVPTPKTHAKYAGMKAQSSYTGALPYNPPLMLPPPPPAAKELPQPSTIYL